MGFAQPQAICIYREHRWLDAVSTRDDTEPPIKEEMLMKEMMLPFFNLHIFMSKISMPH